MSVAAADTVSSIPPARDFPLRATVGLCPTRLALSCRDEAAVCFAVEGASAGETASVPLADGGLLIETCVVGEVLDVGPDLLLVGRAGAEARVRYLVPSSVDLGSLKGQTIEITVTLRFSAEKRPTVDAVIADEAGRPLLWAHDGALPADRPSLPVVRLCHEARGPRLAFSRSRSRLRQAHARGAGLATVATGEVVRLQTWTGTAIAAAIRIRDDDVGFLVVWR